MTKKYLKSQGKERYYFKKMRRILGSLAGCLVIGNRACYDNRVAKISAECRKKRKGENYDE